MQGKRQVVLLQPVGNQVKNNEEVTMRNFVLLLAIVLLGNNAFAYDGNPEDQVNQFFAELAKGRTHEAVENLYSSNPAMGQKMQQLTMLQQQVGMLTTLYGPFVGIELYTIEKVSDSIERLVVIQKYELHPVIWEFYYYKPKDKWIVSQGTFNDQFNGLIKNE